MFHYAFSSRRGILFFFFVCLIFSSFHTQDDLIDKIASSLSSWTGERPQEKVYLHMDKPYYATGDTIWFKAYVTIGSRHQLSGLSGAVYVDLINESGAIQEALKLPLTAGMSIGDFTLSDTLKEGNYRIRAYTQWMRNAGGDYYFDRTFSVGNAYGEEVSAKVAYQYKTTGGQPVVTATINYTDYNGLALGGKVVRYEIVAGGETIGSKRVKTDPAGKIAIDMLNDQRSNLQSAYIRTTIETEKGKKISKSFPIKAALSQSDVQFFPESGELVNGLASRVAFKATGIDGTSVTVKGTVTDDGKKEVATFESTHAGMGTFNLKPEAGKTYKAKIVYPDGSETSINLPKAVEEGYIMAVYQPEGDSILVRINASAKAVNKTVNLIAQTGGEIIYAAPIKITQIQTSVWLQKKNFPSGIAQFTLFDSQEQPVNERIAFIRNSDQMQLKISTSKTAYKTREKVELELEAKDQNGKAVAGSFSVAVIDESKVPVEETAESTIFSNILLTSDLKGYIEKPNYYFTSETEQKDKHLDNLMLTQGYRRFSWKEILNGKLAEPVFRAEKLTTEIAGKVVTLGNKPVVKGKVTLVSLKAGIVRDTLTDGEGRFSFDKLVLSDSLKFSVQARNAKNGKKVEVILDKTEPQALNINKNIGDINLNIADTIKSYLANSEKQNGVWERQGKLNRVQRLKEVVIRGNTEDDKYSPQGMYRLSPGVADQTYIIERPELCATLGICLQGRLGAVIFQQLINNYCFVTHWPHSYEPGKGLVPMQVILNGRQITDNCLEVADIFDNNVLDPVDIAKIEVVRSNLAAKSFYGGSAIFITTKKGWLRKKYDPSIIRVSPKGFGNARDFYSPKYQHAKTVEEIPDLRSTVYWKPNIITAADGKTKFEFFNADDPGNYKVIVEGINAAGELGRQVYRFKVE